MTLSHVHLRNFKSFGDDEQVAPLGRRVTLICGYNSSGKSSLLQSILAMQQSWLSEPDVLVLRTNGERVRLGGLHNVLHHRPKELAPFLTVGVQGHRRMTSSGTTTAFGPVRFAYGQSEGNPDIHSLGDNLPYGNLNSISVQSKDGEWSLVPWHIDADDPDFQRLAVSTSYWRHVLESGQNEPDSEFLSALAQDGANPVGLVSLRPHAVEAHILGAELAPSDTSDRLCHHLRSSFVAQVMPARTSIQSVRHIAQTRTPGQRAYDVTLDIQRKHVGRYGGHVGEMLFSRPSLLEATNFFLRDVMKTDFSIDVKTLASSTGEFIELLIVPADRPRSRLGLSDVGSGVSQVLPIVVQYAREYEAAMADEHSEPGVVWVEQPELHLHPRMQIQLLELLVSAPEGKSESPARPQVVFETHSEVIVVAVQHLVRTGRLDANDVRVLWVGPQVATSAAHGGHPAPALPSASEVTDLCIRDSGAFAIPWPQGMFSELGDLISSGSMS